jgi:UDP-3-O-acyl-N-acetylglucosamine deacetylase
MGHSTTGAVMRHLLLDHNGDLACFSLITADKVHDVKAAHQMDCAPGTIAVDDRGYNNYRRFAE